MPGDYVTNPHILQAEAEGKEDVLYHFGITTKTHDIPKLFSDVKFICCGGNGSRMERLYKLLETMLGVTGEGNLSCSERFVLYKAGPVLCVSHGMGVPSMSVMLVETLKLIHYAGAVGVAFIRVGTSGGIGLEPGTVVVSSGARNGLLQELHTQFVLGLTKNRPAHLDENFSLAIAESAKDLDVTIARGLTLCTDDFYEGQGRLDGVFCDYSEEDKFAFLRKAHDVGVRNIEMESTGFASFCQRAKVPGGIVCVTLLDRLKGDQVQSTKDKLKEFEFRPVQVVANFIRQSLAQS